MTDPPAKKCIICAQPAPHCCSACKDATYCSPECQRTDYRIHKLLCAQLKGFTTPSSPSKHLAILFEAKKPVPMLKWIDYNNDEMEGEAPKDKDIDRLVGENPGTLYLEYNSVRARKVEDLITAFYGRDFRTLDTTLNKGIGRVVAKSKKWLGDEPPFPWRGNVLFIIQKGCDFYDADNPTAHRDARSRDLREIVDYLSCYQPRPYLSTSGIEDEWKARARKLKGVHMTCLQDENMKFTAVSYPQDYPFVESNLTSAKSLSSVLGTGLKFHEPPLDETLEANPDAKKVTNLVTAVHMLVVPGRLLPETPKKQYNFYVVRADDKDLLPEHMEALCHFAICTTRSLMGVPREAFKSVLTGVANSEAWKKAFLAFQKEKEWAEDLQLPWER